MTDRAVSITLNYVLTLVITTLLMSGLLLATSGVLETRQETAIHSELRVIGERFAATLMTADRLAQANGTRTVELTTSIPRSVAGARYTISINATNEEAELVLESTEPYERVELPFSNETNIPETEIYGGEVRIALDGDALEVSQA